MMSRPAWWSNSRSYMQDLLHKWWFKHLHFGGRGVGTRGKKLSVQTCSFDCWFCWARLTSQQTHYTKSVPVFWTTYWGRVFAGQMTQPTVSKHWRKIGPKDKASITSGPPNRAHNNTTYRVFQKTDPLVYFDDNFGKYGPILTIFSLLQQEIF